MTSLEVLNNTINELYTKYQDNEYVLSKLTNWIQIHLPKKLELENTRKIERNERKKHLMESQEQFTRKFLKKHLYFYIPYTEMFFTYDKSNYSTLREDDINHKILSSISSIKGDLMQWKWKIKTNINKTIRNNLLFNALPESITIQNVISNLYPLLFKNKDEAKYFITLIGDSITKTQNNFNDLTFIISYKAKNFLREIGQLIWIYTGVNILNHIKFKYHDQKYDTIRLLNINENVELQSTWSSVKDNIINLIVVACFYSNRYKGSENFVINECDDVTRNHILFLKNNQLDEIVNKFADIYIEECDESYNIPWKNMLFLWKLFLEDNELPNIVFTNNLKIILTNKFTYNEPYERFSGITSRQLPFVSKFIDFWNTYFYVNPDEIEFEISEINKLFKDSCFYNNKIQVDDKRIVSVLKHYFDNIIIEEDKFLLGWSSKLWNKEAHLDTFMESIKEEHKCISIYDAYLQYTKYYSNSSFIVSKRYFEKYLQENYHQYIDDEDDLKF
tara:strand:- start:2354 stop:3865 length:1512 start_codon:yes stop_codon:yes gene_type:complete